MRGLICAQGDDRACDALALTVGMGQGETVSGFSVGFGRLAGRGGPGWQLYEIIDGVTFETIESSWTGHVSPVWSAWANFGEAKKIVL